MSASSIHGAPDDGVIIQLNECFGNVLNLDIIKSVAVSCKYDILESSNRLLEISHVSEKRKSKEDIDMNEQAFVWKAASNREKPSNISNKAASYSSLVPKKSKKTLDYETAINHINTGYKVLILMRGLPGSGKSSLSKTVLEHTIGLDANYGLHILSTDDYFCQNQQNVYKYDFGKLDAAHNWNQSRTFQAMRRGFSPIIIDNTNVQMWEMKAYATMAIDYGYLLHILEPETHWCFNDKELAKRNMHGVPRIKIKEMIDRYEKNITPDKLLSAYNLFYKFQKPPQLRLYPPLDVKVVKDDIKTKSNEKSVLSNNMDMFKPDSVNLMDFDDESIASIHTKSQPTDKNCMNGILSQNTVDKILMCDNNNEINNVLKPMTKTEQDILLISSDDEDTIESDLYSRIERDWGIKESSLKSWDIVTPINYARENNQAPQEMFVKNKKTVVETTDNGSTTEDEYFRLLNNDAIIPGLYGGLKILETVNRDINHLTPKRQPNILLKLTLDKGCMTEDIYEDYENHLNELESLFPKVPKTHLTYWYNKCKGDLEWTIEFLLEAKDEIESLIVTDIVDNDEAKSSNSSVDNEEVAISSEGITKIHKSTKKKMKISDSNSSPDDKEEIKKFIESKIDIGGEHYSKHLLKVKHFMYKNDNANGTSSLPPAASFIEPSTSKESNIDEIISIDSDFEFDEVDNENASEKLIDESVELNLGEYFVSQLEKMFADPNIQYPKGFQPVVQMPVTLAKQLYSFYIESVYQQMENQQTVLENLVKEDEEFARKLQAKEQKENISPEGTQPQSFKEIQKDQQAAKRTYENEMDKWKNFNPDTLAAKLTKQKLFSIFPTIPQDTLVEVLHAHDNKYSDTIETLMASTDIIQGSPDMIMEPPIRSEILDEMKEAQKHSSGQVSEEQQEATFYREEANKYLNKRADLYQKAQQYHQRGMREVAQFYSGLASLQTMYFDRANNMAATAFLDEHSNRLQDFNTLDLHFLYVKEAIPALDVFVDRNINLLRHSTTKQSEYLQIITGRGNRSENGKSKIKPAVISRLHKRNIKFVLLNPGLLKVKITKNSLATSEIPVS